MKSKSIDLNIYMVIWVDACHNFEPTERNVQLAPAADFGFILKATDDFIVLGTQVFEEGYTRLTMTIPRGIIKEIRKIAKVKMPKGFVGAPTFV